MFSPFRKLSLVFLVLGAIIFTGCSNEPDITVSVSQESDVTSKTIPAGYYDTVNEASAATLRSTLHDVIDDHTRIPYTSTATDTWNVLELADEDPNNSSNILDVYLNESYTKHGAGNNDYNREHVWAKSYGFPNDGSTNYPYTDCHHLFLCNDSYNSSRGNKPFSTVGGTGTTEKVTVVNNSVGGGSGTYPGWSGWYDSTYWEVWWDRRGDIARAMFYMDVRYEGGTHGVTGYTEPDLILTDTLTLIQNSNTGSNETTAYMGLLSDLLQWHLDDPVDAKETSRNDNIYAYQGNRNPFIDHPEWVACLFNGTCGGGDSTPPVAPAGLAATAGDGAVSLDWNDNSESDLDGYTVYRATSSGGPFSAVNSTLLTASLYNDTGLTNNTTYYYVVTASDNSSNESASSNEASATPTGSGGSGGTEVWINEFHYDNTGSDTGEFVEIAGTAGTDLSGWSIVAYNGNGGSSYDTENLTGTLPDQSNGFGTLSFAISGIQNGAPDGLALVDDSSTLVMFISYEGSFTASGGAANGVTSTDIGVSEPTNNPVGYSLQLSGTGAKYADFTWQSPATNTSATVNTGQSFTGGSSNQAPTAEANGPYSGEAGVAVSFSSAGSTDADGTITGWYWTFGDGNTSTLENPTNAYASTGNYNVTLTVTDDQGATDDDTATANIVDTTAPADPTGLAATAGDGSVDLNWADNSESDLDGYTVYRATVGGGPYTALNGTLASASAYTDATVNNGTTYYYVVTASDQSANESGYSGEDSALPAGQSGGGDATVWINEFHYDNDGSDSNESFEIAGTAGTGLSGWSVVGYNGANGTAYDTVNLSGTLPTQEGGFGTLAFDMTGMQNGAPDGLALIDDVGGVVMFISYEGSFVAADGAALGLTSVDIGVSESSTSTVGYSLQLSGTGSVYGDFTWQGSAANTSGAVNNGQTLGDGSVAPVADFSGTPTSGDYSLLVSFSDLSTGTPTSWNWTFGDGGTSTAQNPDYTYAAAGTYTVSLTATNSAGSDLEAKTNYITVTTPSGGSWQTITFDDFESGWGNFSDGGNDCYRYTGGSYAHGGNDALGIQDNSGTSSSFYHSSGQDVSGYSDLEVEFWFYAVSMDKVEDFWVQYYDGSTWQTVGTFTVSQDFVNKSFYNEVVTIPAGSYTYPTDAKIRFMCDASGNRDDVYIDEVEFRGYSGN